MTVWKTLPVKKQPNITLSQWSVRELPDGDVHLVGYCIENREGRVSSKIESFDVEQLVAITATGRSYGLIGHPGGNSDAEYVWRRWTARYGISTSEDLSRGIWERSKAGREAIARWSAGRAKGNK